MVLRAFTDADVDLLVELDGDPEVMRWLNGGIPTSRTFIERRIIPLFTSYDGPFGFWAALSQQDGAFLGWLSLRRIDDEEASLGYRFRREAWGQGYATEGGRALIDLAFGELGMRRVMAGTFEHNARSLGVMQRLGMRLRARSRVTAEDIAAAETFDPGPGSETAWDGDDVEYELTADEWRASV
jgi:RimJ/RimL family protein N-acetyltransferase